MYCRNCASEIDERAVVCPNCGVPQGNTQKVIDNGGFGWGLLGCCIPLAGLILYLVWKDTKPKTAKAAGIGALVSFLSGVLVYGLMFFIGILGAAAGM